MDEDLTAAADEGLFSAAEFGVFADATVSVNPNTGMVTCTVNLPHGVTQIVVAPMPVIAAWAMDNPASIIQKDVADLKF